MTTQDSNKVALVTGAGRRIGAEIVRQLHGAGYRIALHYHRSVAEAENVAAPLNDACPDSVRLLQGDVTETAKLAELVETVAGFWGRLDALVNNASSFYPTPVGTVTETQWDDLFASNLKAPFFLAQAAAPHLREQRGCIVNIVDIYAERPLREFPVYTAAKAGLAGLTRALAMELAPAIRVNGVAPGSIACAEPGLMPEDATELLQRTPLDRRGHVSDIARTVLFLMEDAPFVTGQILPVDGGRSVFI
jgi:pteridine reductase